VDRRHIRELLADAASSTLFVASPLQEPVQQRSLDDEALAHVYMATARLQLGEVDGALEAVRPVMDLPPERQISWREKRVGNLADILAQDRYRGSITAATALAEVRAYADDARDLTEDEE
jgi:hypothetical protein